jgi:tetratricopeptide (TPR) repeat protein
VRPSRPARGPAPARGILDSLLAGGEDALTDWIAKHPTNYYALTEQSRRFVEEKKFQEAKAPLQKLIELYPAQKGPDNAYARLAEAHRALGETNQERAVLAMQATVDADATEAFLRLMEFSAAAKDWPALAENAERFLAVNPLVPQPHRFLAQASEALGNARQAITAYQSVLLLDPPDPAEVHFHLAKMLHQTGDPAAKRQVLQSLEEAPRFRDAQRLLLDIAGDLTRNQTNGAGVKQ